MNFLEDTNEGVVGVIFHQPSVVWRGVRANYRDGKSWANDNKVMHDHAYKLVSSSEHNSCALAEAVAPLTSGAMTSPPIAKMGVRVSNTGCHTWTFMDFE